MTFLRKCVGVQISVLHFQQPIKLMVLKSLMCGQYSSLSEESERPCHMYASISHRFLVADHFCVILAKFPKFPTFSFNEKSKPKTVLAYAGLTNGGTEIQRGRVTC